MRKNLLMRLDDLFSRRDDMFSVSKPTFMYIGLMSKQEEFVSLAKYYNRKLSDHSRLSLRNKDTNSSKWLHAGHR